MIYFFFPQGTRMEGYADPSSAAQDAMVNTVTCGLLKHKKRTNANVEKWFRTDLKSSAFFHFFWHNRFYGKHVSGKQANTKTYCKWFSATRVTSSCGWVIQQFSCLNTQWKGKIWLANKSMVYIPGSSVCSRVLAWNLSLSSWSSQNPTDVNGILEVMQNGTFLMPADSCRYNR